MERELPTHLIEGTAFIVDVSSEVLTQEDDASNKLFFHDLKDMGTHYSFLYDRMTKNMPDPLTKGRTGYRRGVYSTNGCFGSRWYGREIWSFNRRN
jgi:hypothetical protein